MNRQEYINAFVKVASAAYAQWTQRLHALRLDRGWSQREVATRMICSRSQYAAIEYGHSTVTYIQLCQLALAFDLTLSELLSLAPLRFPPALVRYAKEMSMPRPKGSRVIVCSHCHARMVGMPGERKKCACGRRYTLPTKPRNGVKVSAKEGKKITQKNVRKLGKSA
jgi:DNA-binding XRE family transcriptional regulator